MKKKLILTDADGVLVFWIGAFKKFMESRGYSQKPDTEHEYRMSIKYGISSELVENLITEFNESELIANLEPFGDAPTYIPKLVEKGFRFIVVTSLSDAPHAREYRAQNLRAIYGDIFDDVVSIKVGASKYETLKRWADTKLFWIEDHQRQAEAGYEVGLSPILIRQPYNSHYSTDLFPTVSFETPWKEIYDLVCKEYNL